MSAVSANARNGGMTRQNIRGVATDAASGQPIPQVSVVPDNSATGTTTGPDGTFAINDVPVGRHDVLVSFVGYETAVMRGILVGSAKRYGWRSD